MCASTAAWLRPAHPASTTWLTEATSKGAVAPSAPWGAASVLLSEPQVGIEPTTARLRIECSTPELLWHHLVWFHALARTRTATPCGTTPSRWRVYQFHHQGKPTCL